MARIAMLLPYDAMLDTARQIAALYQLDIVEIASVHDCPLAEKLQQVVENGAEILIARGGQAKQLAQLTTLPVVELRITGQELALLVKQAIGLSGKAHPIIGLTGIRNMLGDTSALEALLDVQVLVRPADSLEELRHVVDATVRDGADVLIGGSVVESCAARHNLPFLYMSAGADGLSEACRVARQVSYAIDRQKQSSADLRAILDYTTSGIIQIDAAGIVRLVNPSAEQLLDEAQPVGKPVWALIPALTVADLAPVLQQGRDLEAVRIRLRDAFYPATVSAVFLDGAPSGAIISISTERHLERFAKEQSRLLRSKGYLAPYTFERIPARSAIMQELLEQALRHAASNAPILLRGEFGTEKAELAQAIHNASIYAENAFVSMNCGGLSPEESEKQLFGGDGEPGLLNQAQGDLFLDEISRLSPSAQYRLYRILARQDSAALPLDGKRIVPLRILAADSRDLSVLVEKGEFRADLYYMLCILTLDVPPLRQRPEDIPAWFEWYLQMYQEKYARYIHLTKGAWKVLQGYSWPGNLVQLRTVAQRVLLQSPRRTVEESFLEKQLRQTFPGMDAVFTPSPARIVYRDPKAAQLEELLQAHHGNRTQVARELGISTTTLWRYIRKYALQDIGR